MRSCYQEVRLIRAHLASTFSDADDAVASLLNHPLDILHEPMFTMQLKVHLEPKTAAMSAGWIPPAKWTEPAAFSVTC